MKPLLILYPKIATDSVKKLQESLIQKNIPCVIEQPFKTKNRYFSKKDYSLLFNYGTSCLTTGVHKLNKAFLIKKSISKLKTFEFFKDFNIPHPEFTTDYNKALQWVIDGFWVAIRQKEKANNSQGLLYCQAKTCIIKNKKAPLFTKYIVHEKEYRINCWQNKIISVYEKILTNNNTAFKFILNTQFKSEQLNEIVNNVYKALPLDWYGLDVVLTENNNFYVLEINSAPILFPYTIKKLITHLKKELSQ